MVDRPRFARDFPADPALDVLVDAFARGDYAHVRRAGVALGERAVSEDVRVAARVLVERTKPDPVALWLLALAGALLLIVSTYWIARARPASSSEASTAGQKLVP